MRREIGRQAGRRLLLAESAGAGAWGEVAGIGRTTYEKFLPKAWNLSMVAVDCGGGGANVLVPVQCCGRGQEVAIVHVRPSCQGVAWNGKAHLPGSQPAAPQLPPAHLLYTTHSPRPACFIPAPACS